MSEQVIMEIKRAYLNHYSVDEICDMLDVSAEDVKGVVESMEIKE